MITQDSLSSLKEDPAGEGPRSLPCGPRRSSNSSLEETLVQCLDKTLGKECHSKSVYLNL